MRHAAATALPLVALLALVPAKGNAPVPADPVLPLIPAPARWEPVGDSLHLQDVGRIVIDDARPATRRLADLLAAWWREAGGRNLTVAGDAETAGSTPSIRLALRGDGPDLAPAVPGAADESHEILVAADGIAIRADAPAGLFRGVAAVRQLALAAARDGGRLACGRIAGSPRFRWRGMLLDSGRHMQDVAFIKDLVDLLALYGFNVLHWHLTEDQGWRLEVPGHPRLTEIGAWRTTPQGERYGGFYTAADVREVVAHAAARFVTVVPEIELPGHCTAALAAYPELSCTGDTTAVEAVWGIHEGAYCAGNDSVFAFLGEVFDHVVELFPAAYVHVGGDEVLKDRWRQCPRCQARLAEADLQDEDELQSWFIARAQELLAARSRKLIGWDEILAGGLAPGATVQSWRGLEGAVAAVRQGSDAIVSPTSHAYFDQDPGPLPLEHVLAFDPMPPGLAPAEEARILGGEMNLWTEYIPQARVHAMLFPRLAAMAEVLGAPAGPRPLPGFLLRLQRHEAFWPDLGVTPGTASRPVELTATPARDGGWLVRADLTDEAQWRLDPAGPELRLGASAIPEDWRPDELPEDGSAGGLTAGVERPAHYLNVAATDVLIGGRVVLRGLPRPETPYGAPTVIELNASLAHGLPVTLAHPPSPRYPGEGKHPLTNGLRGGRRYADGAWVGFEGVDLAGTIDLGQTTRVTEISLRSIQDANAWIFLPAQVTFLGSSDGTAWHELGTAAHVVPTQEQRKVIREFGTLGEWDVRYVRVVAQNLGVCPDWHPGRGRPCWVFVDEIRIR